MNLSSLQFYCLTNQIRKYLKYQQDLNLLISERNSTFHLIVFSTYLSLTNLKEEIIPQEYFMNKLPKNFITAQKMSLRIQAISHLAFGAFPKKLFKVNIYK